MSLTLLEDQISVFELKQELSRNDRLAIQCFSKRLDELSMEYRKYYYAIIS